MSRGRKMGDSFWWCLIWRCSFSTSTLSPRRRLSTGPTATFSGWQSLCVLVSFWNLLRSPPQLADQFSSSGPVNQSKNRKMLSRRRWVLFGEWDSLLGLLKGPMLYKICYASKRWTSFASFACSYFQKANCNSWSQFFEMSLRALQVSPRRLPCGRLTLPPSKCGG